MKEKRARLDALTAADWLRVTERRVVVVGENIAPIVIGLRVAVPPVSVDLDESDPGDGTLRCSYRPAFE